MNFVRIGLYVCVVAVLVAIAAGCSATGTSGIAVLDNLTGQTNGSFRVQNVAAVTTAANQVQITVTFNRAVNDSTVVANSTVYVVDGAGNLLDGVVTTGTTANDATVVWTSNGLFAAGAAYTITLVGDVSAIHEASTAVILSANGVALDGNGVGNVGDGLVGGNWVRTLAAPAA